MDWMPKRRAEKYLWWKNLSESIDEMGPLLGLSPADIAAAKALADEQIATMADADSALAALKGAQSVEATRTRANEAKIRQIIRRWRTLPDYGASGTEGRLQLAAPQPDFDPDTFRPVLRLSIVGGHIRVAFTKGRCHAVVIYSRRRGTAEWTRIGQSRRSPYHDRTPLADPAVPEVREYQALGMLNDVEIGQPSRIGSITLS